MPPATKNYTKSGRHVQGRTHFQQVFVLGAIAASILTVVGLVYGFHIYGDERLCPDRESLVRKIRSLKHEISYLKHKAPTAPSSQGAVSQPQRGITIDRPVLSHNDMLQEIEKPQFDELMFRRNTRYWLETKHIWPKDPIPPTDKYVTFEPWRGGFNNIRMSLEMAFAAAFALNRTLVLPPSYDMYLRGRSSFSDYFDYEDLRRGVPTLTFDEFRKRIDMDKYATLPREGEVHRGTSSYYKEIHKVPGTVVHGEEKWEGRIGSQMVYCVPECPAKTGLRQNSNARRFFSKFSAQLKSLNANDPETVNSKIIHYPANLLGHFYTMFWFQNPQLGRRMKRLVRDHIHFKEVIVEQAERLIKRLGDFKFSCLHIRRNDFQFKEAWTSAEDIVANTKRLFKKGEKIYIATDELSTGHDRDPHKWSDPQAMAKVTKHTWFQPLIDEFGKENVFFLSDFYDALLAEDIDKIHIGSVESVVCSRARVFVGTRKSTFSGYIHRMRGYMHDVGQKELLEAQSKYPEDYFATMEGPSWSLLPRGAYGGGHPYWGREYKDAWENVYNPIF